MALGREPRRRRPRHLLEGEHLLIDLRFIDYLLLHRHVQGRRNDQVEVRRRYRDEERAV